MGNNNFAIEGVYAAALTPLTADRAPDLGLMASHCLWLLDNGCDGLAILGTTGEANSFGLKERIGILEGLAEAGLPAEKTMPGTGACAVPDAVALTRVAVDLGAPAVLMLPPFYYKNSSNDGLFAAYSEIIQKLGDEKLKICLYHFPQMSGVPITYPLIEMLLKTYPKTVVGMKDSSGDFNNMSGAAKVYGGWKKGEDTAPSNEKLTQVRQTVYQHPLPPALKALMARHSGNDGWLNIRPPLMRLGEAEREKLFGEFDAIGYELPMAA